MFNNLISMIKQTSYKEPYNITPTWTNGTEMLQKGIILVCVNICPIKSYHTEEFSLNDIIYLHTI